MVKRIAFVFLVFLGLSRCGQFESQVEKHLYKNQGTQSYDEICDGLDNDGNKLVDDGIIGELNPNQKGICQESRKTCNGDLGWAEDYRRIQKYETLELSCDGVDNDCDGNVDNNLTPPLNDNQRGVCLGNFHKKCNGVMGWQDDYTDIPGYESVEQTCDGLDNDCDGQTDNGLISPLNSNQRGVCDGSKKRCRGLAGWQDDYSALSGYEANEITCDNLDNNCNGEVDEEISQTCGSNVGECRQGTQTCSAGLWSACVGEVAPTPETCDNKDNNCDGTIDNFARICGSEIGECQQGLQACNSGTWGECTGSVDPAVEICDNKDNDCDGDIDEQITRACTYSLGYCDAATEACSAGIWGACTCTACTINENYPVPTVDLEQTVPKGTNVTVTIDFTTSRVAFKPLLDLILLLDNTGSMHATISAVQSKLSEIVNRIRTNYSSNPNDVAFSATSFRDYPTLGFASSGDSPFVLNQQLTTDTALVQNALNSIQSGGGADVPEADMEALYQVATGNGYTLDAGLSTENWLVKPFNLVFNSSVPGTGTLGGVGIRENTLRIVVHATDSPYRAADRGSGDCPLANYSNAMGSPPNAHSCAQAIQALNEKNIKVIGLASDSSPTGQYLNDMKAVAIATNAVAGVDVPGFNVGDPLVYHYGSTSGNTIADNIMAAIEDIVASLDLQIGVEVLNTATPGVIFDFGTLTRSIISGEPVIYDFEVDNQNNACSIQRIALRFTLYDITSGTPHAIGSKTVGLVMPN